MVCHEISQLTLTQYLQYIQRHIDMLYRYSYFMEKGDLVL